MNFLTNLLSGAAKAAIHSAVHGAPASAGLRPIESLCSQLQWQIDERVGDTGIALHFKHRVFGGVQPVLVTASNQSELVVFSSFSRAQFRPDNVPPPLAYYLLVQNKDAFFHSWRVSENDDGTIGFAVSYGTFSSALSAPIFKIICESMCKDVCELDAKLRQAGVL